MAYRTSSESLRFSELKVYVVQLFIRPQKKCHFSETFLQNCATPESPIFNLKYIIYLGAVY